ncbi:mismatch-specific DNA-glycosylase [Phanerochaete sordida]|uniref:Mismatch-specific DNA-glycosylase n=1 Tax=Phanerochaete sordida TaxID=48140 RepID=A0A9P3LHD0_9APHY|nr:mismatch-specific DNA-glycosylase [Phanerochaete sordida]
MGPVQVCVEEASDDGELLDPERGDEESQPCTPATVSVEQFRTRLEGFKFNSPAKTPSPRKRPRVDSDVDEQLHGPGDDDVLPVLTSSQASPWKKSRKRPSRPYAPPEKYEHLHMLPDYLQPGLDVVFCGINPGRTSAEIGHHYAHSTNHFWLGLHQSGLTGTLVPPQEDYTLPERFNFGLTNLVDRPTAEQSELSANEMRTGVPTLMTKLAKHRPRIVCFLSKGIWETFLREAYRLAAPSTPASPSSSSPIPTPPSGQLAQSRTPPVKSKYFGSPPAAEADVLPQLPAAPPSPRKRSPAKVPRHTFAWGLQPFKAVHRHTGAAEVADETLFFVVPSPSARVVAYQWWDKVAFFKRLRELIPEAREGRVDASAHHVLPLTTTKSVYFMNT